MVGKPHMSHIKRGDISKKGRVLKSTKITGVY